MKNRNYTRHGMTKELFESGVYHMKSEDRRMEQNLIHIPTNRKHEVNYEFISIENEELGLVSEDQFDFQSEYIIHQIQKFFSILTEKERFVLQLFYGLNGYTPTDFEEIGSQLNITRERTRQIKEKAIRKIKRNFK